MFFMEYWSRIFVSWLIRMNWLHFGLSFSTGEKVSLRDRFETHRQSLNFDFCQDLSNYHPKYIISIETRLKNLQSYAVGQNYNPAMLCNAMQCYATLYNTMQLYTTLCNAMQRYATLCNTMQPYATLYNAMQPYISLYNTM